MAISTFTLNIRERTVDGKLPTKVDVKVYPLATADGVRLKRILDTTGNIVMAGHAEKVQRDLAGVPLLQVTLPDPRDVTLNPAGFGFEVRVTTNYFSHTVVFGATEIAAAINGGAVELEDVMEVDTAAFVSPASYVSQSDYLALLAIVADLQARMDDIETHTALPFVEDPPGSGLYTIVGLTEDPDEAGLYSVLGLTEDSAAPGLYLIGA
jgi:hypothetical protein